MYFSLLLIVEVTLTHYPLSTVFQVSLLSEAGEPKGDLPAEPAAR
jgi:hypothetical protein